jgi:hypothetical protein
MSPFFGWCRRNALVLFLTIAVVIATAIPIFHAAWSTLGAWQGVPSSQDNYYYARMHEVKDGYPFIGNPYFLEHRDELSPAFFVSDWIASIPLLLGVPIVPTIIFNLFAWALVNTWLFYLLFRILGCSKRWAVGGALLAFLTTYFDLTRPVSLQVIAPAFTLLCITAMRWLEQPLKKKRLVHLALALTLSVYVYTYLTQIALVFLGLVFFYFLWRKQWREAKALFITGCGAGILSLPFAWYAFLQVNHPFYWETMVRIGLVNTHMPTLNSFANLWWVAILLASWLTIIQWRDQKDDTETAQRSLLFFILMGVAMVVVTFSSVITGKELEIAQHVTRFIALWYAFAFVFGLSIFVRSNIWQTLRLKRRILLVCLFCLSLVGLFQLAAIYGIASLIRPGVGKMDTTLRNDQSIGPAIAWLEKNETRPRVIWTPEDSPITNQIPVLSKHYVLFVNPGILHILSDKEVEERYLLSKALDSVTVDDIKRDFKIFAGAGNAVHASKTHNRGVRICQILLLNKVGVSCREMTDPISLKGEVYFANLYTKLNTDIRPNLASELAKFHVSYVVADHALHPGFESALQEKLPTATRVFSDARFSIYKLAE